MNDQTAQKNRYMVSIYEPEEATAGLLFTFVPRGLQQERGRGGAPKRVPQFIVTVHQQADGLRFQWSATSDDPGPAREEIEAEIASRLEERSRWVNRVTTLVGQVEEWARELNWSTRRLDKNLDDTWIGKHRVPALLLQESTCRILLEPIARSAPGAEGVVDLYLMPAYDDIAVLFYYRDRWNIHHNKARGTNAVMPVSEAEAIPLSKESLEKVLSELTKNAA